MYRNAEKKSKQFIEKMAVFVLLQQTSFINALLFSIYCICIGNFDTSTYYLPLRLALPFSIDSMLRWYLFLMLQVSIGFAYVFCAIPVISFFVCCCFYLDAICDHFDYLIALVDAEFGKGGMKSEDQVTKSSLNARNFLINSIDHHNKIYE